MKKQLLIILFVLNCLISFSQTNTITVEDTNLITTQRWRDTCFNLIKPALVLQKFYSIKPHTAVVVCCADGFVAKQSPTTIEEI